MTLPQPWPRGHGRAWVLLGAGVVLLARHGVGSTLDRDTTNPNTTNGIPAMPLPATYFERATDGAEQDAAAPLPGGPHEGLMRVCHLALAVAPTTDLTLVELNPPTTPRSPHHATVVTILRKMIEHGSSTPDVCSVLIHRTGRRDAGLRQTGGQQHAQADAEARLILAEVVTASPPDSNMTCTWAAHETRPLRCQDKLRAYFEAPAGGLTTQPQEAIMLGDSTMARLHHYGKVAHGRRGCRSRGGGGLAECGTLLAMDLNASRAQWVPPRPGVEGPGSQEQTAPKPFCTECTGCRPWIVECCPSSAANIETELHLGLQGLAWSYLGVEFARDVSHPTIGAATTQETVASYLAQHPKELCVVSAGLHDMAIDAIFAQNGNLELRANQSTEQHVENVRWYLTLLQPGCRRIAWLSTSAVRHPESRKWLQRNWKIAIWNAHVAAMIRTKFPSSVFLIDVYPKTITAVHHDNVHLTKGYYTTLGEMFQGCLGPAGCPRFTGSDPDWYLPAEVASACSDPKYSDGVT